MEKDKMKFLAAQEAKEAGDQTGKKRGRACHVNGSASPVKRFKAENGAPVIIDSEEHPLFEQPALVTGAKLKQYQLEGVQWMVSLDQNGISGILGGFFLLGSLPHRLFPFIIKPTRWALEKHYRPLLSALTFASAIIPDHSSSCVP